LREGKEIIGEDLIDWNENRFKIEESDSKEENEIRNTELENISSMIDINRLKILYFYLSN